ncbi:MAG: hypothetical protein Kilf2KO_44620 [Rhodospirillales bacterium]
MTEDDIRQRLKEAARTLRALPGGRPAGYRSSMPDCQQRLEEMIAPGDLDFWAHFHRLRAERIESWARIRQPSCQEITRMDEALDWLYYVLQPKTRACVWSRAEGVPLRRAGQMLGLSKDGVGYLARHGIRQIAEAIARQGATKGY